MTILDYVGLSIHEQISMFYEILERIDRDYSYKIDKELVDIIFTEIWMLDHTEDQMYAFEYLTAQTEYDSDDYVYTAKELEDLYESLLMFRDDLFKKYNI